MSRPARKLEYTRGPSKSLSIKRFKSYITCNLNLHFQHCLPNVANNFRRKIRESPGYVHFAPRDESLSQQKSEVNRRGEEKKKDNTFVMAGSLRPKVNRDRFLIAMDRAFVNISSWGHHNEVSCHALGSV